ncbi:hypothetical protein [endosymbiont GvMRE of Glomus versiforme]|uniref:hypothetical protein n=1 Tax=endosymbiont GvMRE of Glomus versiforme TaxID=2039283 RepID=UPI000EED75C9|nr:hypothetical protein [endosymbiont GvMRE of Glomus versiforme]RHZ37711.1 hypothetical protein GvMRE_I1g525 [endosymbiont GvMRE of Glomus versiforme]
MKNQELKNLLQNHYNRIKKFNRQEWNKMLKELNELVLVEKEEKKLKLKKQWAIGYDIQGKKIEADSPTKCPNCQTAINETEMDIVKSNSQEIIWECLNCGQEITIQS